jgi:L-alanine-DL-glutamate epimerase-like enolase superfamily enzyme
MRIKDVVVSTLYGQNVDPDSNDSAQDTVVVEIVTDEGLVGIGETTSPPSVIKAIIEMPSSYSAIQGLRGLLIGEDPLQIEHLWVKMYEGTIAIGRRGLAIHAISAIDLALWDLAGKIYDQPVWKLLGGAQKEKATPYASLFPVQNPNEVEVDKLKRYCQTAKTNGFRAAKIEILMNSRKRDYQLVQKSREFLGDDMVMMADAFYCWPDFVTAYERCKELEKFNLYFIEAPLHVDDISGYARLSEAGLGMRVAIGERATTRYEFMELIDRGKANVVQPDLGRVGGFTEAKKVADYAKSKGVLVTPHAWRTGITIAASLQFCIATSNCPYFEYMVDEEETPELGRSLVKKKFNVRDGQIEPPECPGLGVELDRHIMEKYAKTIS